MKYSEINLQYKRTHNKSGSNFIISEIQSVHTEGHTMRLLVLFELLSDKENNVTLNTH